MYTTHEEENRFELHRDGERRTRHFHLILQTNQDSLSLSVLFFSSYSYSYVLNYIYFPFIYTLSNTLLLHYTLLYKIEHFTICAKSIFHHQN